MKHLMFFFFISASLFGYAQSKVDVLHYKYSIELNDNTDTIYGQAEIKLKFIRAVSSFKLDLILQNDKGKGMKVDGITGPGIRGFVRQGDSLEIILFYPVSMNDTASFIVTYHGIPSDGLIISKNKYGQRTFFADNWPNRAHNWIPCIDDPADKASFEFIVTAPSHYRVISNGVLSEEINLPGDKKLTHWKEDVSLPTKVMVIGVADFAVKIFDDSPAGIPASAWVYPQDSVKGFKNYSVAPSILKFLSAYIGPYPYEKLANVQSKTIFGGMENASAIFYDEGSASSNQTVESLLAHEISHQWFGDMATEKSFAHLWLSEGFATYLTHIYIESKYGTDSLNHEMQKDREDVIGFAGSSDRPVVDPVSPLMQLLNANSYQKGGWILHMLRRQLGDSVFHLSIRRYYEAYKGKNADTKDLQVVFEKTSGKNLDVFFRQWLYHPDLPRLMITWKWLAKQKKVMVTVVQFQKEEAFQFPLEIALSAGKATQQVQKMNITQRSETFTFMSKTKPTRVIADPFTSLLFEGAVTETK